jgi:trans-aconitate methyltransferase
MWHYLQGGNEHFPADRRAGDVLLEAYPDTGFLARQCRQLLARQVGFVAEAGIDQFLDLGCGLPAAQGVTSVHQLAQAHHPHARVVYVDNDPAVAGHARAQLERAATCAYLEADARDIDPILREAARTVDFDRPLAVILFGLLGAVEWDAALTIVTRLTAVLVPGSYLLFQDGVNLSEQRRESVRRLNATGTTSYELRTPAEMARYFDGYELVEPGLVAVSEWRPPEDGDRRLVESYCAVARKPL